MTGTLLSADDPRIAHLIAAWPEYEHPLAAFGAVSFGYAFPRSAWLADAEAILRELHPTANSDSLTLTARSLAPFPLTLPGVP